MGAPGPPGPPGPPSPRGAILPIFFKPGRVAPAFETGRWHGSPHDKLWAIATGLIC